MDEKNILLVEDNPDDEELTLRALKKSGITNTIVVVHDGQQALDYLFGEGDYKGRNTNDQPQVVLLDINLPKLGGIDVLRRLRADPRTAALPVVVLTSSTEERDMRAAYTNFANSYICKPVDFEQFSQSVQQLGLYWLVLNRPPPKGP